MLFKSTTNVTSAVSALLQNQKGQRQAIFITAVVAAFILWKMYAGINATNRSNAITASTETSTNDQKMAGMKWSYDELAHKLIVENTDLAYAEIGDGFSKGIGRVLNKVTRQGIDRQNSGKRVVANL